MRPDLPTSVHDADIEIGSISISGNRFTFEWAEKQTTTTGAVRLDGAVIATHVTHVDVMHPAFRDEGDSIHDSLRALLLDALDEWQGSEPVALDADEDEDGPGMGE